MLKKKHKFTGATKLHLALEKPIVLEIFQGQKKCTTVIPDSADTSWFLLFIFKIVDRITRKINLYFPIAVMILKLL
jgi:hypothetical protein